MRRYLSAGLTAIGILICAGAASAQSGFSIGQGIGEEEVTLDADSISYDEGAEEVRAQGDVVISSGQSLLAADRISVRQSTGEADASGSVVLTDPEARIRADRAVVELRDETGYLVGGEVLLEKSRFLLSGERLEKGIGHSYRIWDGAFTTCLCDEHAPDWSIEGDEIDLSLGGWGEVRGGTFKVKDVPVLFLPYGLFPVRQERQTGFLFPRFGISSSRGFQYVQPFYWAIDKSSDLTLSLDIETKARIGLLADYRYVNSATAGGRLTASYFNQSIGDELSIDEIDPNQELADPTIPENRWSVIGYDQREGPFGTRMYARPFYVSDNLFLRDMNTLSYLPATNLFLTTIRYTTSDIGISKSGEWGEFKAEARWYQDLIEEQSRVPQPVPDVRLRLRERFFDLITAQLDTQAVYYYRSPLSSGPRLDIAPKLSVPFRLGNYAFGSARLTLRETLYYLVNNDVVDGFARPDGTLPTRKVDRFQHREILQAQFDVRSELSRVFDVDRGALRKLKHTIEPFAGYLYIPYVNQDDLPLYDGFIDRINARNLVSFGFLTRLLAKFGPDDVEEEAPAFASTASPMGAEPYLVPPPIQTRGVGRSTVRELGRLQIQQSYSISRPISVSTRDIEETSNFSGIDMFARLTPVSWAGLTSQAVYSPVDNKFIFANVGANIFDPRPIEGEGELFQSQLRPPHSASIFYQFNTNGAVENLNLATTFRLNNHLAISYLGRFDGESGRFLENWAGFRVISDCDCWVFDAAFVDRVNPDEVEFRFRFSLVGLGTFGQSPFAEFGNAFPTPTSTGPEFGALY
jgi:LPS-assembly protein